jgi:hypothetical protein
MNGLHGLLFRPNQTSCLREGGPDDSDQVLIHMPVSTTLLVPLTFEFGLSASFAAR